MLVNNCIDNAKQDNLERTTVDHARPRASESARPDVHHAAPAPPSLAEKPPQAGIRGHFDRVAGGEAFGWLFDPEHPDEPLSVEVRCDDQIVSSGLADQYREDLDHAGIGNGRHGFRLKINPELFDAQPHALVAQAVASGTKLRGGPHRLQTTPGQLMSSSIRGCLERISEHEASGWACDLSQPESRLEVEILAGDVRLGHGVAEDYREDLASAGIGDGCHGFRITLDQEAAHETELPPRALITGTERFLPTPPTSIETPAAAQHEAPPRAQALPDASEPTDQAEARPSDLPVSVAEQPDAPASQQAAPAPTEAGDAAVALDPAVALSVETAHEAAGSNAAQDQPQPAVDRPAQAGTAAEQGDGKLSFDNPADPPFENTRDTRYFFPSSVHAEALSRLFLLAQDRNMGIGVLTGEIGAGKTLLRTLLYARLASEQHLRVSIENSLLDFDGLLLEILSQMQGERLSAAHFPDRYTRLAAFKRLLSEQVASRERHLVVLIDEAQQLSSDTLECLKGLTNIASERQNFLTLILIGQPELRARLKQLPQVDQRVSLRFHLSGLDRTETGYYVRHRFRAAGFQGEPPVSEGAIELIHRTTRGIPREINRLCKLALDHLLTHSGDQLNKEAVAVVVNDLRRHGALETIADEL